MNENTRLFVEALRSGHYKQAQEVLVKIGGTGADGEFYDEATAYCCLGLGSKLAGCEVDPQRGVRFTRPEFQYTDAGEIWYHTLPGRELFDWLGIDVKENNQVNTGDRLWGDEGRDIMLDVAFDVINYTEGQTIHTTSAMKVTLANLNDWGCTFDQIADMIERFGFKGAMVNA